MARAVADHEPSARAERPRSEAGACAAAIRQEWDIAVVGAGPAGAAAARGLAQAGCRVVLVERSDFAGPRVGESLAPGVQPLLRELGVWAQFLALQPLPSHGTRSLWGGPEIQEHSHLITPWGCGWHVDRGAFDRMLAEAAHAAGAQLLCRTTFHGCHRAGEDWELELECHNEDDSTRRRFWIRAKLMIDATGRVARLARWAGAKRLLFDRLVGIATEFHGIDVAHAGYVMVEAARYGWWYTAPIPGDRMVAMLMTDSDLSRGEGLAAEAGWYASLRDTTATWGRLAGGAPAWGPRLFAAVSQRLCRNGPSPQWLAVGDAALAVDPITGSGVVRALRSAKAAVPVVLALLANETPLTIDAHERERDLECTAYLQERAWYYGMEQRWRNAAFWRRRASEPMVGSEM